MSQEEMRDVVELSVDGPVATVTLQREKQLNALNRAVLTKISEVAAAVAERSDVRVVLLRGAGRAFAAGADIAQMRDFSAADAEAFSRLGQAAFAALEALPQPTIALVHGYALGGGLELAMACDIRIAAEGAKFGQPEVTLGVVPGFGGSQRLPRLIGQGNALYLLLTGEMVDAAEAMRLGLVSKVVPQDELETAGRQLAERLLTLGPYALAGVKRTVYEGAELDLHSGLRMEAGRFGLCFAHPEQTEGMTAFLERRKPDFPQASLDEGGAAR
ncbi:MAG: enoyl-CoA hydratase/isomerase family protein [Alicyclobacillus sp.]|nr:enoyl-CoA hydratase/isomerase family protein [Alicyclobacillus sp.]